MGLLIVLSPRLGQVGADVCALAWAGFNEQLSAGRFDAVAHAGKPVAGRRNLVGIKAVAVVTDFNDDLVIGVVQRDIGMAGFGVLTHVGE